MDSSHGYEAAAEAYISRRDPTLGVSIVKEWASALPSRATVLDLGCGPGLPLTAALVEMGHDVYGVDASARMVDAFRKNLPNVPVACEAVEDSAFFDRTFDGVVAWGLMFLLPPATQALVIGKVARALNPGGRLLFTAPLPACSWADVLTGLQSTSLGADAYRVLLASEGLRVTAEQDDEGENHYMHAVKGDVAAGPRSP